MLAILLLRGLGRSKVLACGVSRLGGERTPLVILGLTVLLEMEFGVEKTMAIRGRQGSV